MDPNDNPTQAPPPGSGEEAHPRSPDTLPVLGDAINEAYRESHDAAIETGRALIRARSQLRRHEDWIAWLANTCDLSAKGAERYIRLASKDEEGRKTSPLLPADDEATVVCGWCLHARAAQDLPPKHLSGPRSSEWVRHGECEACREALERTLRRLRKVDPQPLDATAEDMDAFRSVEWNLACSKLRSAFHHTDQALVATRTIRELQNLGLTSGIKDSLDELVKIQDRLARLTCELLLLSEGSIYDAALFEPDLSAAADEGEHEAEEPAA